MALRRVSVPSSSTMRSFAYFQSLKPLYLQNIYMQSKTFFLWKANTKSILQSHTLHSQVHVWNNFVKSDSSDVYTCIWHVSIFSLTGFHSFWFSCSHLHCFRFSLVLVDESFKRFSLLNLLTCNMGMHCSNTEDIGPWTTRTSLFNLVLTQLTHSVKHAFIQCIQLMKHSDTARTRTQLAHACSKIVAALCPSSEPQWMRNIIFKKGITFLQSYKHVTYLVHSLACHSLF